MQIAECHCCKVDYHELLFLLGTSLTRFQPRANLALRTVADCPVSFIASRLARGSDIQNCQARSCPDRGADPIWPLHQKKEIAWAEQSPGETASRSPAGTIH